MRVVQAILSCLAELKQIQTGELRLEISRDESFEAVLAC